MRWREGLATMAIMACACTLVDPNDTGAGGGGGAAPTPCDGKNDCNACSACAAQMLCATELDACTKNAACAAIDECVSICGADLMCKQQCVDGNPGGIQLYDATTRCLYCNQCPTDCAGFRTCG